MKFQSKVNPRARAESKKKQFEEFKEFKELPDFRRARSILAWPRSDLEAA